MIYSNTKIKRRSGYLKIMLFVLVVIAAVLFVPKPADIIFIDRKTGKKIKEKVPGDRLLSWLYYNPFGKIALHGAVKRKILSEHYGKMMDSPNSKKMIYEFIKEYNIEMDEFVKKPEEFSCFNEFFYRELKPGSRKIGDGDVVSPADGKIIAFNEINATGTFFIKGKKFDLKSYFGNEESAKQFEGGAMAIIRLAPVDYHRFHFPCSGKISESIKVDGDYYSVSPLALKKSIEIFMENKREYSIIENERVGKVAFSEIGATMVGSIVQTFKPYTEAVKGSEKGYFKFGGSSVMILFQKNKIKFDEDIVKNTKEGFETYIKMGENIASVLEKKD